MTTTAEQIAALHNYAFEWLQEAGRSLAMRSARMADAAAEFRYEAVATVHAEWQQAAGAYGVYKLVCDATVRDEWGVDEKEEACLHYLRSHMMRMLLNGPDDTWSGRGNDARRAYHDGVREAWQRIAPRLEG